MKVVQINAVYGEKSTGLIVRDIQEMLLKEGVDAFVAYQKSKCIVPSGIKIGNKLDWKLHAIYTRLTGKQGYASKMSTRKFLGVLDDIKPEVIHLHNLHANYINLPLLLKYCAQNNIKTILTLHDCWFFTGKCFHFFDIGCERYQEGCYKCPKKRLDIPNYTWDRSRKIWNERKELFQSIPQLKVIGCSEWISNLANSTEIFQGKYIRSIHNGIDASIFKERSRYLREELGIENTFVILCMANKWFEPSNQDVIACILKKVSNQTKILLVGCNEMQKRQLNNDRRILPLGYIHEREKLADIYSAADIFLNLSVIDNLPTVNMEAIACGTPVICYNNSGGGPELIEEGITGFVVDKFDGDTIAKIINQLMKKGIDRYKCIRNAEYRFSKEMNYKKYLEEYLNW